MKTDTNPNSSSPNSSSPNSSSPNSSSPNSSSPNPSSQATTFNTWGRVAEDQMQRMGDLFAQGTKMQAAAFEHGRELLAYNMKLAGEWQTWASETGRTVANKIFASK